jgi:hypothetical protein
MRGDTDARRFHPPKPSVNPQPIVLVVVLVLVLDLDGFDYDYEDDDEDDSRSGLVEGKPILRSPSSATALPQWPPR